MNPIRPSVFPCAAHSPHLHENFFGCRRWLGPRAALSTPSTAHRGGRTGLRHRRPHGLARSEPRSAERVTTRSVGASDARGDPREADGNAFGYPATDRIGLRYPDTDRLCSVTPRARREAPMRAREVRLSLS